MRPRTPNSARPRVSWLARWPGALAAILCATCWLLTLWAWVHVQTDKSGTLIVDLLRGSLHLFINDYIDVGESEWFWLSDASGYGFWDRVVALEWLPRAGVIATTPPIRYLELPLWLPFLFFTTISVVAWRRYLKRRGRPGLCPRCGYDLSGLPAGSPCPECGQSRAH